MSEISSRVSTSSINVGETSDDDKHSYYLFVLDIVPSEANEQIISLAYNPQVGHIVWARINACYWAGIIYFTVPHTLDEVTSKWETGYVWRKLWGSYIHEVNQFFRHYQGAQSYGHLPY